MSRLDRKVFKMVNIGKRMKRKGFLVGMIVLGSMLFSQSLFAESPPKKMASPGDYGNLILGNYAERYEPRYLKKVVFPHWFHRIRFTCKVCHSDVGFTMKIGADDIKMTEIFDGQWCGKCHNGKIAFLPLNCSRCHSLGREVPENSKLEPLLKDLPADKHGNKIDWVKALVEEKIKPKSSLDGDEEMLVFDRDIQFKLQGPSTLPEVIFPHKEHTQWLFCNNCHPQIFKMKAGANPVTRADIDKGKFCGACHGKVAFPLTDCKRCHNQQRLENSQKKKIPPAQRDG